MRDTRSALTAATLGAAALLWCLGSPAFGQTRSTAGASLALVGGTLLVSPTADPIQDGAILIQDGKIVAVGPRTSVTIPADVETLDGSGLIITAGFWNSHVHFMERKWSDAANIPAGELTAELQDMLTRYGVTSAFDTGSTWENTRELRDRIESGEVAGPRIRSTGMLLSPKGAAPPEVLLDALGFMSDPSPEVADAAEARAEAKKLLDAGTDGIKLYAATWFPPFAALPEDAIRAAVEEAHRRGKPAFAHPTNREGLLASVNGGVDVVVHTTPQAGPWDDETLAAMKQAKIALIPTLKLWKYELRHDRAALRDRFAGTGVGQLRAWAAAGGTVLFGTDVGYMGDYDPSDEYALMAEAGMTWRQILASLTTAPAERFGDSERLGQIAPGFTADLVVLGGDPARDVRAFAAVAYTIRDGVVIYRSDRSGTTSTRP